MERSTLYVTADGEYLVRGQARAWIVFRRCDCVMGPHWHEQGIYQTVRAAERSFDWQR